MARALVTSMRVERHVLVIPAAADGLRLDQALARLLAQYSRSAIKHWIDSGQATLNQTQVRPRARVRTGDSVEVLATLAPENTLEAQAVEFEVVHADDDIIVIDKPAGLVVHPGAGNPDLTLVNGLLARFPELVRLPRAGLVHRIDKDTTGLLIAARSPAAYQTLVRALAARRIARVYHAVVNGVLVAGGSIDAAIARDPQQRTRMRVSPGGRAAVTHYRVLQRFRVHSLLEVHLETGRTHQIRVHLAWRGHPLVGDARYGGRPRLPPAASPALQEALRAFPRQALHAHRLELLHPVSALPLCFVAPLPADMCSLIEALREDVDQRGERT